MYGASEEVMIIAMVTQVSVMNIASERNLGQVTGGTTLVTVNNVSLSASVGSS